MAAATSPDAPVKAGLSIDVLRLVTEERNTYGLRHQDFDKYRAHCARKVHNLRKAAGLTQVQGKAKKYVKKDVTAENAQTNRHLLVLLFEAERAWAHSRELKTGLQATNPDKQGASHSARVRHHANSRLSRAIHYASTLLSLLPSSIDVGQRAQLHSYLLYLRGLSCFERTEWQAGLSALSVSMTLLLDLSERQGSSAHESALANEWVDEVSPLARFCAYKLEVTGDIAALCRERAEGGDGLKLVEGWDGLQADLKKGNGQKRPDVEVQWRGVKIEIRNAELADAMTNTEATISKLAARRRRALLPPVSSAPNAANKKRNVAKGPRPLKSSSFDAALLALSDAESISRRLVEDNAVALSRSQSSRFEASSAPLRSAHSYIAYRLLSVRIERDSALVRETLEKLGRREAKINDQDKRPTVKDVEQKLGRKRARVYPSSVKLLDGIILSLEQMRELTLVESDVDLSSEVDAKISFVSARRCAFQARTYDLLSRSTEALSLNQRAKLYVRQARANPEAFSPVDEEELETTNVFLPVPFEHLDVLDKELEADAKTFSRRWFDRSGGQNQALDGDLDSLSLDAQNPREKKGTQPKVFDVAFNYAAPIPFDDLAVRAGLKTAASPTLATLAPPSREVEMEQLEEVVAQAGAPTAPASKKGLWGFWSR